MLRTSTAVGKKINPSHYPRIIVVESDTHVLRELERGLHSQGCDMRVGANWRQAADLVARSEPDLVILDIEDVCAVGWQVLDTLKHQRETRSIPVIVWCSAAAAVPETESVRTFREYGVEVVAKKAHAGDLVQRAKALLTERASSLVRHGHASPSVRRGTRSRART